MYKSKEKLKWINKSKNNNNKLIKLKWIKLKHKNSEKEEKINKLLKEDNMLYKKSKDKEEEELSSKKILNILVEKEDLNSDILFICFILFFNSLSN